MRKVSTPETSKASSTPAWFFMRHAIQKSGTGILGTDKWIAIEYILSPLSVSRRINMYRDKLTELFLPYLTAQEYQKPVEYG